jgi:hypothetical protein
VAAGRDARAGSAATAKSKALQAQVDALLEAGKIEAASKLVPDLIAAQSAAFATDTLQLAAALNRAGVHFFGRRPRSGARGREPVRASLALA